MKKQILITATMLLFITMVSAQPLESVNVEGDEITPGVFGPDSFLYPAQVGVDNLLNSDEENVVKRAIEANQMLEAGNAPAAERALNQLQDNAQGVSRAEHEYLEEAQRAIASAPYDQNAKEGIDTARDAIEQAQERRSGEVQTGRLQGFSQQFKEGANNIMRGTPEDREPISERVNDIEIPDRAN